LAAALSWSSSVVAVNATRSFTKDCKKTQKEIAGWLNGWVLHYMGSAGMYGPRNIDFVSPDFVHSTLSVLLVFVRAIFFSRLI